MLVNVKMLKIKRDELKEYLEYEITIPVEKEYDSIKEAEADLETVKEYLKDVVEVIVALEELAKNDDITEDERQDVVEKMEEVAERRKELLKRERSITTMHDALIVKRERQFALVENLKDNRIAERIASSPKGGDVRATRSYELAWAKGVMTGDYQEARALISTQNAASGGLLVPKTLADKIEDVMFKGGRVLSLCSVSNIKGITYYPVVTNKSDPEKHAEPTDADGTDDLKKLKDIVLTSVTLDAQFIAERLYVTRKFEVDNIEAFWDWLMQELPDALRRVVDRGILTNSQAADAGLAGILTNTNALFVGTLAGHVLNFNTANQAVALLDDGAEDNIHIVMNRNTFFNNIMGLRGTDGHPIFRMSTENAERPSYFMGGYPVVFSSNLPPYDTATAGSAYMVVGNFQGYRLNFPNGMDTSLKRDDYSQANRNVIQYISEIYVAGNIIRPGCFVKVTKESSGGGA